ncbi:MAG: glucose-phosphate thymidylyltransferase [Verrucomicrobiota bacterium]|jgi:glucose-1-phosphate thymidylyltransferase
MNALILAAGYATRLYPLTLNKAKPLLEVAGKPIIEWVVDNLAPVPELETIYVVTNNKFAADFSAWAHAYQDRYPHFKFKIINDGSASDDDKLGAIGDINLVLTREDAVPRSDLIVVAGDNLFSEPLGGFAETARNSEGTIGVYDVGSLEAIKKYGCAEVDAEGIITHFEEKPAKPKSTLAAIALYYYARDLLPLFKTYIAAGNNPDQPGRFVQWLYTRKPLKTFQIKGKWLDIGSKETLEEANKVFAKL